MSEKTDTAAKLPPVQQAETAPPVVRDGEGRFVKGKSGNPAGRPQGRKAQITVLKQEMELAIRQHVRPEKLQRIVEKIANKAANGNVPAAKLIFDHFLSKATDADDPQDKGGGLNIVIQNLTQVAPPSPAVQVKVQEPAIDAQFTEERREDGS